tara:strand:- start:246 stop:386 length:141 start_codon:yes stop_codon:yes gene_type:complete
MTDTDLIAFGMWSGITAILMVITGFVYKSYQKKKSNQSFASSNDTS